MGAWDRVRRNGKTLTRRDWALLDDIAKETRLPIRVIQGSWANGSLSAGTHTGAGAFDLSISGMTRNEQLQLVNELRRRNVAAWLRSPEYGWPRRIGGAHIHGIVKDTPGLSYGARRQVINYNQRQNGLSSRKPDPHYRPKQTPFRIPNMSNRPTQVPKHIAVKLANLRYGLVNDDVRDLQRKLCLKIDGHYGPQTDAAVRQHQKKMGLTPDRRRKSFVGPKQAKALGLIVV